MIVASHVYFPFVSLSFLSFYIVIYQSAGRLTNTSQLVRST